MARVQLAGWRAGFAGIVPVALEPTEEFLARRTRDGLADPARRFVVAELDGAVRGWCGFGPTRDDDEGPGVGEIYTLFVEPGAWRHGLGRAALTAALAELSACGFGDATVWSFAANARANAFYERLGFARDAAAERRDERLGDAVIVRYRRPAAN